MAWNNNGGGQQGPWGSGSNAPQPPDLEKIFRLAREKLMDRIPGGQLWPVIAVVAFLLWMATGIYVVGPDEQGVVVRFGRYVETTDPGPHFHLPYPIETVYTPQVTQIQRIEIGYRSRGRANSDVSAESLMLTGDENIIDIDLSVQYRIQEGGAANFLFNVRNPSDDPHNVVRNAAESAIRQVIGRNDIDTALTTGKEKIQTNTRVTMQEILDSYKSGIIVVNVQLQQVAPPQEVIHAFKDVASAREDRERSINEAQGYKNDIIPRAKGQAAQEIQQAEGYKATKIARAKGEVNRFLALVDEYEKAPEITRTRLYLETMEEILGKTKKVILHPDAARGVLPFLPLAGNPSAGNPIQPQGAK
ncbi:MAG: FtsH protease activity modulator HflK [Magnetococcales bacterium]|nr:FtsH protease activity modulator HflK [Magnetococcales bacterium]MBF0148640.1 FtsH protease activity modulator HflK [Magnetococcales bacterium]MBF0172720.1 FtsH protease activity modulator HflK [Magnetococcales bacterium]MBF0346859.1 FtsH protease activity modulator HflK [Magnetococcales bacterium]MBF0630882.1 FtsH protease activity modulator HflK [Magnetococcales bacterium]